jgi:hypothetical protein
MIGTGKTTHVRADLGHDQFGGGAGHARNCIQQANRRFKRGADRLDPCLEAGNRLVEAVDLT